MATENLSRIASDFETQISTAGIAVGDSSFKVLSVVDADGNTLSDGIYCFTIDRDSADSKEYLIGQLTTATKTVSSVSSVSRQGVLTANAQRSHRIGANVIISDHSILAAVSRIFTGQGTINPAAPLAYTTAPTLSSATEIATKGYVDSVVTGGTVNTDRIILGSQTAGETVAAGNIVYFKSSDSRWWLADADLTATFSNVLLGVALGSGTAGNTISGGVQIYGKCDSFTGLTATATYYLSNTAGGVSSSAGTYSVIIGQAFSTTGIFFNPNTNVATAIASTTGASDAGKVIKTNASGLIDVTFTTTPIVRTYTTSGSPHTWTKPTGLKYIIVEVQGAGGGGKGSTSDSSENAGGGAGGYAKKLIASATLGATETATVGTGGAGGDGATSAEGSNGGNSTFTVNGGSTITGNGGSGSNSPEGGAGGSATNGDINIAGGGGGSTGGITTGFSGFGGGSIYGNPTLAPNGSDEAGINGSGYGSGGSGASYTANGDRNGGSGANGIIIVTEYYN